MIRRFLITGFLPLGTALLFLCGPAPLSLDGGGTDFPNTKTVMGALVSSDGKPSSHSRVLFLSSEYNVVTDSASSLFLDDTTDGNGTYSFSLSDTGEYTITAVQLEEGTRTIISGIHVLKDTVKVDTAMMQKQGTIEIEFSENIDTENGYFYIPGTTISVMLNGESPHAILDSVPAGAIPSVNYGEVENSGVKVTRYDVTVSPGETAEIRYPFWNYAKKIYFNTTSTGADVSADMRGFPALLRLSTENFSFDQATVNGADIRFAKDDGTPLFHEIERWDPVAGFAEVWVRVDTLFGDNDDQNIMMYWGASTPTASGSNGAMVFDTANGFQGVWHCSESEGSVAFDATVNGYNGMPRGKTLPGSARGMIGNAFVFNGSNFVDMVGTASSTLNFPQHGTYSVSAWVNIDSLNGEYQMIASKGDKQYNLQFREETKNWQFTEYQDTTGWDETVSRAVARSWVYLVGVRSNEKQYLYVNGACADSTIYNLSYSASDTTYAERRGYRDTTRDFMIGKKVDYNAWFFKGSIDEVRVSGNALRPEWIKLCYMNQRSGDMLVVFEK
jgi:hypothetical protein